ncbi:MAG TPA: proline/glycine betaine ABC transporter permease [Alphaproteobacteria bacterium]|nr:proline/glycine betaine ABC transporter permease [Alphaproteobacteria bacterium]
MADLPTTEEIAARQAATESLAPAFRFSAAALLLGPLWAARSALWITFFWTATIELVGLVAIATGLWPVAAEEGQSFAGQVLLGVALVLLVRLGLGAIGPWLRQRLQRSAQAAVPSRAGLLIGVVLVVLCYGLTVYRFVAVEPAAGIAAFPAPNGLDNATAHVIDVAIDWAKKSWVAFFDSLTAGLRAILNFIEACFIATPWPVVALASVLLAWRLSGRRAMIFAACGLAYLGLFGFWEKSMGTMALIATSVVICVVLGIPLGVLCAKSRRTNAVIEPILDIMQTLPTFVYLIPAVAFFSIGKPPGVIATVIFALPPMVRLTALGIRHVPAHVREAADAFGASPAQMLFKVELPLAIPSIRLGINQTIMMCLSMVVVAAMIGAGGLGLDVMHSLQHLKTGQGFLAGIAIVVCAMVLDRVVRGREESGRQGRDK